MAFYGVEDDGIEKLKEEQEILLDAIRKAKVSLDSVAFLWMVRGENEQE